MTEKKEHKKLSEAGKISIHKALNIIQLNLKAQKGQFNKFGKYKYRSCEDIVEAVKVVIRENDLDVTLILSDEIVVLGERFYIKAAAMLAGEEISRHAYGYAREPLSKKGMDESQITGTASSYARKYALNGLFAIDDTKDADTDAFVKQTTKKAIVQEAAENSSGEPDYHDIAAGIEMKFQNCTTEKEVKNVWMQHSNDLRWIKESDVSLFNAISTAKEVAKGRVGEKE